MRKGLGSGATKTLQTLGLVTLGREPLLDAPPERRAEPLDGPVDGRVHMRSRDSYSERACGLKSYRHNTGDPVAGAALVRVTQYDPNPTDASSMARQDGEHAIFGVGTGLSVDGIVTADDSNSIHTQGNRKARANPWTSQGPNLHEAGWRAVFRKESRGFRMKGRTASSSARGSPC